MSTRVCSPPSSIMDITRDIQGCPTPANPTSGSLPVSSATQSLSPSNPFSSAFTGGMSEISCTLRSGRPVARSLFGPPDPRSGQYARAKVTEIRENDKAKWNFDFDKEEPLPGRFLWERMTTAKKSTSTCASPGKIPKAYELRRMPYLFSQSSATSTVTSTDCGSELKFENREALLIVSTVEQERPSSSTCPPVHVASTSTCPPPTPAKSPENRAFSPDRLYSLQQQHPQVSTSNPSSSSLSSLSSQSSPESSSDVIISIPSPPTSLEEGSSSPSSSVEDSNKISQEELSEGGTPLVSTTVIRSKKTKISDYMQPRKRPAANQTSSSTPEKKAAL